MLCFHPLDAVLSFCMSSVAKRICAGVPLFLLLQQAGNQGLLPRLGADGGKTKGFFSPGV